MLRQTVGPRIALAFALLMLLAGCRAAQQSETLPPETDSAASAATLESAAPEGTESADDETRPNSESAGESGEMQEESDPADETVATTTHTGEPETAASDEAITELPDPSQYILPVEPKPSEYTE
ncbi:MAG: hypothetical protein LUH51_06120 [Firmicutes bacterium]|nr:hypothetical protein [Bacillota bacterium]